MKKWALIFASSYLFASQFYDPNYNPAVSTPARGFHGCMTCSQYSYGGSYSPFTMPMLPFAPAPMPWWQSYNQLRFNNFRAPAPWGQWGIHGQHFPRGGDMIAGKPNIYISAPLGSKIKFKINFKQGSKLIASTPSHAKKGWSVEGLDDGNILEDGERIPYLYYDYRTSSKFYQNERGFCPSERSTVAEMAGALADMGFRENEIHDFIEYWSVKTPANEYCIFPQEHEQLDPVAKYEVSPKNYSVTRVLFVLIPRSVIAKKEIARFSEMPKHPWFPRVKEHSEFQIREWGVAFGVEKP